MKWNAFLIAAIVTVTPFPTPAAEAPAGVDIREWPVPWENTRPRDPFVAPDGRVWFVGQTGDYIASFDPKTEEFHKFDLEDGTGPHNLVVDKLGTIWFTGNRAGYIGKMDPDSGAVTHYRMPDPEAGDPHTMIEDGLGNMWFTVQGGNFVGRLTTSSGEVRLIKMPTPRARPYGIEVDYLGKPWIAEVGTNKIATVNPATMEVEEFELPRKEARPRRIDVTSTGDVWYVDYAAGYVGRFSPTSGQFDEWRAPSKERSAPYAMAVDDNDRIWFVETGPSPNVLVSFDPTSGRFVSQTPIPSGGGAVRHMMYDSGTGTIWFGTDTNNIGRAVVPEL
jgi:virginiamycin B lyase